MPVPVVGRFDAAANALLACGAMATTDEQALTEPLPCAPCRGTGQVISNLGGAPATIACPWCEGSAMQAAGHDAQAARRAAAAIA